jgi:hypothetical protein
MKAQVLDIEAFSAPPPAYFAVRSRIYLFILGERPRCVKIWRWRGRLPRAPRLPRAGAGRRERYGWFVRSPGPATGPARLAEQG